MVKVNITVYQKSLSFPEIACSTKQRVLAHMTKQFIHKKLECNVLCVKFYFVCIVGNLHFQIYYNLTNRAHMRHSGNTVGYYRLLVSNRED